MIVAEYELTLRCTKDSLSENPVTIKTKADVDEEDVKDILTQLLDNSDVRSMLRTDLTFVVEKVIKKH
jgi:hypothetical protein